MGKKWRPEGWAKDPCDACPDKINDEYGRLCNWYCHKQTEHSYFEAGADAMLESLKQDERSQRMENNGNDTETWEFVIQAPYKGYIAWVPDDEVQP